MSISHARSLVLLSLIGFALTACSTVGEKSFSCPGRPVGVHCMTTTEVYEATENTDVVAPTAPHALGDDPVKAQKRSKGARERQTRTAENPGEVAALQSVALTPAVDKPTPIRTPAKVMRAWFAPWADTHDVLHAGGYQFVEIDARRWSLGEPESSSEPVRSFAIPKVGLPESVGKEPLAQSARAGTSERSNRTPSTLPNPGAPK